MAFVAAAGALPTTTPRGVARQSARSSGWAKATAAPTAAVRRTTAASRVVMLAKPPGKTVFDGKVASSADLLGAPTRAGGSNGGGGPGFTPGAELANGPYAMSGFLAGLVVELGTGQSIYSQAMLPVDVISKLF